MLITLDATALLARRFGIGFYAENLIRALAATDAENMYQLLYQYVRPARREPFLPGAPNFRLLRRRMPYFLADLLFNPGGFVGDGFVGRADVFHALRGFLPRCRRVKTVWTLYDLAFKVNPEWFTPETSAGLEKVTRRNLDRADHVITISEHTRDDLVRFYDFPAERITPILLGVPRHALEPDDEDEILSAHPDAPMPYFLFVGTLEPRKNVVRLVEAFSRLDTPHALVLVGAQGWLSEPVFAAIAASPRRDKILWRNYCSAAELERLYRHAEVFVYPSLYEGFGLPVLEAMAHGCPVITARTSSLPEVGGDAVVYVDPEDTADLADEMKTLATNESIRQSLAEKGKARAAQFSWQETAQKTRATYSSIIS